MARSASSARISRIRWGLSRRFQMALALARCRRGELSRSWAESIVERGSAAEAFASALGMLAGRMLLLALFIAYWTCTSLMVAVFPIFPLLIAYVGLGCVRGLKRLASRDPKAWPSWRPLSACEGWINAVLGAFRSADAAVESALWNLPPFSWLAAWEDAVCLSFAMRPADLMFDSPWSARIGMNPYSVGCLPTVACLHSSGSPMLGPWKVVADMELARHCHAPIGIYGAMRHLEGWRSKPRAHLAQEFEVRRSHGMGNPFILGDSHLAPYQSWFDRVDAFEQARQIAGHVAGPAGQACGSRPRRRL